MPDAARTRSLRLAGDVDAAAVPLLRARGRAVLEAGDVGVLALDLAEVTALDSSGLGMLVQLRAGCLDAHARLVLCNVPARVQRLLATTGLEPLFEIAEASPADGCPAAPDRAEAVAQDEAFDRFARLVRRVLDVPVATVALVDEKSHTLPGLAGLTGPVARTRQVPLSHSLCSTVVREGRPLVLTDARVGPAFATHPAVVDQLLVAYAGMPLLDLDGRVVGTLCATDMAPRAWTAAELDTLADIAAACSAELQLRGAICRAAVSADRDRMARHLHENVTSSLLELALKVSSARSLADGRAADLLEESVAGIDAVLRNIRRTLYEPMA